MVSFYNLPSDMRKKGLSGLNKDQTNPVLKAQPGVMISEIKNFIKENIPILVIIERALCSRANHQLSRSRIRHLLKKKKQICIEVGAGDKKGENGWITIDITKSCDIYWDLRRGIPFPDSSVHKIYSSHFLEHLFFKEGQRFLHECLRVLVPGGIFSICVPNARIYIEAYLKSALDEAVFIQHEPAYNHTTKIDYINYMAYMDGHHKYMFDEENLIYLLTANGFKNVHLREFDANLDLREHDYESIYAEAEK